MARVMLDEKIISNISWVEVIHTTVHILNKYHFRSNNDKTPNDLWYGKPYGPPK